MRKLEGAAATATGVDTILLQNGRDPQADCGTDDFRGLYPLIRLPSGVRQANGGPWSLASFQPMCG